MHDVLPARTAHCSYSPVMGVAHSPLWPRVYETFGEDPLLAGAMGAALVAGLQASTKTDDA